MAMQFYASPEQVMRDRAELARKGIARGRSAVIMSYEGGVLFVAENLSSALHKVSEVYDRIGFAAVGRYNEFESLRAAGVRLADLHGYSFDRRDVTGRAIANTFARTLGAIFTEQSKPFEVEICVAEVGPSPETDELYRLTYDGSVQDEPGRMAMGGQSDSVATVLRAKHRSDLGLAQALAVAVEALSSVGGEGGKPRELPASQLEVAVLDRGRAGRAFRRITGAALTPLLAPPPAEPAADSDSESESESPAPTEAGADAPTPAPPAAAPAAETAEEPPTQEG
ncbi:MAG: proteasome subunit alpha [Dactylosporangium sp.]|nr:proteasome subunit alpha [Dactylosporangium sp.]NNJ62842.1 proteasome subunit alpha [Dactylosporangium sp.]